MKLEEKRSRTKVCFVCNEYPPLPHGGIGVFVRTLAEELVKLGADVSVVGYGKKREGPFEQNGVKVFWLYFPDVLRRKINIAGHPYSIASVTSRWLLSLYVNRLVRAHQIEVVESYDFTGPLAMRPPCRFVVRLAGSLTVTRYEEGRPEQISPIDRYYEKRQLLKADRVVAVSHHIGAATNKVFGIAMNYDVIYNGVDTSLFYPRPVTGSSKRILFVGNIMWRKGVFDLIKAAPLILERHPAACFSIAGAVAGVHLRQLESELSQIPEKVRMKIEVLGNIAHEDLPALYNQCEVFVFPSRVEAFGLTCAEAMACGRPIVATKLASGPELIEDGTSGILADPTNPRDLAQKINYLLDNPPFAKSLGECARQKALEKFSLHDLGRRNLEYYQSAF